MRVNQVDPTQRVIRLEPGTTKNRDGREVIMTDAVHSLLSALIHAKQPDDYVFTRDNGKPVRDFRGAGSTPFRENDPANSGWYTWFPRPPNVLPQRLRYDWAPIRSTGTPQPDSASFLTRKCHLPSPSRNLNLSVSSSGGGLFDERPVAQ